MSHGVFKTLTELLTVKSDFPEGKPDLIEQIIKNGVYNFPEEFNNIEGGVKKVVSILIKYLQL